MLPKKWNTPHTVVVTQRVNTKQIPYVNAKCARLSFKQMKFSAEWKFHVDKVIVVTYFLPWNNGLKFYMNFINTNIIHAPPPHSLDAALRSCNVGPNRQHSMPLCPRPKANRGRRMAYRFAARYFLVHRAWCVSGVSETNVTRSPRLVCYITYS